MRRKKFLLLDSRPRADLFSFFFSPEISWRNGRSFSVSLPSGCMDFYVGWRLCECVCVCNSWLFFPASISFFSSFVSTWRLFFTFFHKSSCSFSFFPLSKSQVIRRQMDEVIFPGLTKNFPGRLAVAAGYNFIMWDRPEDFPRIPQRDLLPLFLLKW